MPIVQADRLTKIGAALLRAAGASPEEADAVARRLRQRQPRGPRLARHHRRPDLHRPHQGRPHRARRAVDDRAGVADHHRHRRPLGLRLPRQRQGDAADHRQGEEDQRRRLHGVSPEPRRPARRLSADGDARRA